MKTLKFKCKLLSDIILSEHASTEGTQKTLDFIPGNVFLGLVAGKIYKEMNAETMLLFHSGKVRFGDAHPLNGNTRAIRVPASWYLNKGKEFGENPVYVHPFKSNTPKTQCRDKFIVKTDQEFFNSIKQEKSFAIKSAYDKATRRSKDQQMYGYQSLEAGMEFCFQIDLDDLVTADLAENIKESLIGKCNIGRSKTAQYGQVEIVEFDFQPSFQENKSVTDFTFLYAESRLLFLDENGQPVIPMDGKSFEMEGAKVDLERSQIRTFRYAPYNFKRQARDADRYGIEKGSVICLEGEISTAITEKIKKGIGLFLNEGFGKVLINPEFLTVRNEQGEAIFLYQPLSSNTKNSPDHKKIEEVNSKIANDPVFLYLKKSKETEDKQRLILDEVNTFVKANKSIFSEKGELYASQWGTIRMKAVQSKSKEELNKALFLKAKDKDEEKKIKEGYLVSGISASKWEGKRLKVFKEFFEKEETTVKTIINLAAEMAKICQKKGGNQ
jgi:hypothetical protein